MPASVLPVWSLWRRLQSQRDFVVFNPRYARRLESLGLKNAASIVDLPGEVISGHADRHVVAVNVDRHRFILKREHCVAWRTRWRNLFAGFGWVSLSGREAKVLDELAREEVPVSRWLAYGEHKGRAFLLLRRERGRDLRWMLRRGRLPVHHRRSLARSVGQAIAAIVRAGMSAPDLSAKHILVRRNRSIVLLDWPRARRSSKSDIAACVAMLARLHASLAPELATARERVLVLKSCLQTLQMNNPLPALARRIAKLSECHARSRSIREQLQEARREPRIRWLDGERICVTNDCWDTLQGRIPDWLANAASGCPTKTRMIRLAVPAIGSAWLLQVPPSAGWRSTVARIVEWPVRSPAIAQAGLLFRLARHGVPVPQVLAFGGRDDGSGFLLAKTQDSSRSLRGWLALPRPERGHMLRRLGQVLHRCHAAGCFNIASESLVVVEDERPQLRLEFDPAWKKSSPPSEEVKAAQLQQLARDLGLTRSEDIAQLSHGYAGTATDVDTGLRVADCVLGASKRRAA
ncbi:MAG: lipopolysaccharide kinase InaA family protein [Gemmataceae bacterium]